MNQFKSGTLLVVAVTIITAILILTTTRDTKTITPKESNKVVDVNVVENTTEETIVSEVVQTSDVKKPEVIIEAESGIEKATPSNDEKTALVTQTAPIEIKAPEGPYGDDVNITETTLQASDTEEQPTTENLAQDDKPIKAESINVMATSNQHELLNHLIQPIWMDQKLGDFKSLDKSDVVFKMMPTSPQGLQGENPKQVVTNDSDKFGTTTVSADYNYQQMPMYNGGYYIAPMPPYLMESMLPVSNQDVDQ